MRCTLIIIYSKQIPLRSVRKQSSTPDITERQLISAKRSIQIVNREFHILTLDYLEILTVSSLIELSSVKPRQESLEKIKEA